MQLVTDRNPEVPGFKPRWQSAFFCFVLNVDTLLGSVVDSTESPDGLALSQLQRVEREIRSVCSSQYFQWNRRFSPQTLVVDSDRTVDDASKRRSEIRQRAISNNRQWRREKPFGKIETSALEASLTPTYELCASKGKFASSLAKVHGSAICRTGLKKLPCLSFLI